MTIRILLYIAVLMSVSKAWAQHVVKLSVIDSVSNGIIEDYNLIVNGVSAKSLNGVIQIPDRISSFSLKVTRVGYNSYEAVYGINLKKIEIKLSPAERLLEEVVINTGYQRMRREQLTGAVEALDKETLQRSVSSNILNRLEDMTTSLSFDRRSYDFNYPNKTDGNLNIRGISSINSSNTPLIVLDNFPCEGDVNNINPNDIANITILKDATAASIWGAKAGNGVIVITTKRGNKGHTDLNYTSVLSFSPKPDLFRLKQSGSGEFIEIEKLLFGKGFFDSQINDPMRPALSPAVELLVQWKEGTLSGTELDRKLDRLKKIDIRDAYMRNFYRTSVNQQHSLSLNGGSEYAKYYISSGYDKNQHVLRRGSNSRWSFNSAFDFKISTRLQLRSKFMFINAETANSPNGYEPSAIYPYAELIDPAGVPLAVNYGYRRPYLDGISDKGLLDWNYKPMEELLNRQKKANDREMLLDLALDYKLWKGFSYTLSGQYATLHGKDDDLRGMSTYDTRNMINLYTRPTANGLNYAVPLGAILDQEFRRGSNWAVRNQFNYDSSFDRENRLTVMFGNEIRSSSRYIDGSRLYGFDENTKVFAPIDQVGLFQTYDNLRGTSNIGNDGFYKSQFENRFVSFYGNLTLTLKNRYNFYASARKDASNIFGTETNNKWTPLWSIGVSWDIKNEFFLHAPKLSVLKLRASFGYSGNVNNTVPSRSTIYYAPYSATYSRLPFAVISNPPNPSLRWEKVRTLNMGVDFGIFNNRLSGAFDFYSKASTDLIAASPVDPTAGVQEMMMNNADTKGTGADLTLNSLVLNGDVKWRSTLLLSYNKVMITNYKGVQSPVMSSVQGIAPIEGQPAYAVFSYRWGGLDPLNGDPVGFLGNERSKDYREILNQSSAENLIMHGAARPLWFGSLRNELSYGKLSISFNIALRFKYFFRRPTIEYGRLGTWSPIHEDFLHRWKSSGDELVSNIPSFIYPNDSYRNSFYEGAEINVEKGDHIRLRDLRIAYRLDNKYMRNAEVFCYLTNIGFLWRSNSFGLDPDLPSNGIGLPRTISFGTKFTF